MAHDLFTYARKFADRHELAGKGTKFPTVRQAARRFRCTQDAVIDCVESSDRIGDYFGISVGVQIGGGGGYASHASVGDYEIEAYREPASKGGQHE